jgi:hypothetical protein
VAIVTCELLLRQSRVSTRLFCWLRSDAALTGL